MAFPIELRDWLRKSKMERSVPIARPSEQIVVPSAGPSEQNSVQRLYTLLVLPIELLIYIFSFVTSARDKANLRYASQGLRAAVEMPSLWRNFTWPHYDFREENSIKSVLESCGRHVKRLSFPSLVRIPVESLQHCSNVLRLSLPSIELTLNQVRTIMQSMKKLQHLDVLWTSKNYVKHLLSIVGYPVYGYTIKELTIRTGEQLFHSAFDHEMLICMLTQWEALRLTPHTLNIVSATSVDMMKTILEKWVSFRKSRPQSADHIGHLNVYRCRYVVLGLETKFPYFQYQITGSQCVNHSFVIPRNCGLLGLNDCLVLKNCTTNNGDVLHKAVMISSSRTSINRTPLDIIDIEFLTHFSCSGYEFFNSDHLEKLAIACPNLQQLNLIGNVHCLKKLQGLRAIALHCRKLEGLDILQISVDEVECCVQLWEILADLQLTYLAIDMCCLFCFEENDQTNKEIIIGLHQKCVKMRALEVYPITHCTKCDENKLPLVLSNFPLLIHCITMRIENVKISERLRYFWYVGDNYTSWPLSITICNLEQLCIEGHQLAVPDNFMHVVSAHGGLVLVILDVASVTKHGIVALVENSPNLITCHIYVKAKNNCHISRDFRSRLKKKYSQRKLFLCGSCHLSKGVMPPNLLRVLHVCGSMDFFSLWIHTDRVVVT